MGARYKVGQKYCKRCGEFRYPNEDGPTGYHKGKIGHWCNDCNNRVRSYPRHTIDRQKYVEAFVRL